MVAHFTMRRYGVNQEYRFDQGIWLCRKSGQIRFIFWKIPFFTSCVHEQPFNIKIMRLNMIKAPL